MGYKITNRKVYNRKSTLIFMKKELIIPTFGIILLALALVNVSAALIKTTPEKSVWIADGTTEYKINVYLDNTGLNGTPTDGLDWKLYNTPSFNYVNGSASRPSTNDFFHELQMFWEIFGAPGQLSSRIVTDYGAGPVNSNGFVAQYKFKVPEETAQGIYHFELDNYYTRLWNPEGNPQTPLTITYDTFQVVPPSPYTAHKDITIGPLTTTNGITDNHLHNMIFFNNTFPYP